MGLHNKHKESTGITTTSNNDTLLYTRGYESAALQLW